MFEFARFKLATTAPVVGEIVKVVSPAVTEETPPWMQEPETSWKQPPTSLTPFAKVEVAEVEDKFKTVAAMPEAKVEVERPRTSIAEVATRLPTVVVPAKSALPERASLAPGVVVPIARLLPIETLVEVAAVVVEFTTTKFVMVDEALLIIKVEVLLIPETAWRVSVLVAEIDRRSFNLKPLALISEVQGVCAPLPQDDQLKFPEPSV